MSSWDESFDRPGPSSRPQSVIDRTSGTVHFPSGGSGTPDAPPLSHSNTYNDVHVTSRPTYRHRSVTEPVLPPQLRKNAKNRGGEREWTVFGQLMEDSAQVGQRGTTRLKTRPSKRSILATEYSAQSIQSPSRPRSALTGDDNDSIVQSPLQEQFPSSLSRLVDDSESENSASDDEEMNKRLERSTRRTRWLSSFREVSWRSKFELTPLRRNILKCAIAYLIASLFTYVTPLSHLLGSIDTDGDKTHSASGHMVATIAVYFNPAKTIGGMLEADLYCFYGVLWSFIVSMGSMALFWWIDVHPGWEWLAAIVALIWIGLGMTVVAGMKVWMNKPSFNTACSMTTIIIFLVVIKEGGIYTLLQVARIVFAGAVASNICCYVVWPQSASKNLRTSMSRSLTSFATLLQLITDTFLISHSRPAPSSKKLQEAIASHQACFTSLNKSLSESRAEFTLGNKEVLKAHSDAVGCLNRLAQHLNGLRSGTRLQAELSQAAQEGRIALEKTSSISAEGKDAPPPFGPSALKTSESTENLQVAASAFVELIEEMGPPLQALSNSCTTTLRCLEVFFSKPDDRNAHARKISELTDSLQKSLFQFESTSNQALLRVYRRSNIIVSESTSLFALAQRHTDSSEDLAASVDALLERTSADETVFQVYFFIFTLQEFAKELAVLGDAVCRLHETERQTQSQSLSKVLHRWFKRRIGEMHSSNNDVTTKAPKATLKRRISAMIVPRPQRSVPVFPKIKPHAPNTMLTPGDDGMTVFGRLGQKIWRFGEALKHKNIKFAIKAGMATGILAAPAFFEATRPYFIQYRGDWVLISYFIVISPTVGATNFLVLQRLFGSLLGAIVAVTIWSLFPEKVVPLSVFGFFFSIPCFYYIVARPDLASSGRFALLTYNLTCLYCYNIRQREVPILEIAYYRAISVALGVLYAALVSRYWWPAEARRELGKELSEFCLNLGWLYTHLVAANSGILVRFSSSKLSKDDMQTVASNAIDGIARDSALYEGMDANDDTTETTQLLRVPTSDKLNESIQTFMAMELHLQVKLIELQGLLKQAQREPRLKGPFPVPLYRGILTSLQTILDRFHSMRCVTTREEWFTSVRKDFVIPVNKQRRDMVGNVILYFSVLSAAFKLKTPLPPYLPPAEESRLRLVNAIRQLDIVKSRDVSGSRQLLFFAYALTMKGVIDELDFLGQTVQDAFGVIGQTVGDFESMFIPQGYTRV